MRILVAIGFSLLASSCAQHRVGVPPHGEIGIAHPPKAIANNSASSAGPAGSLSPGPNAIGVTIPTGSAIVGRIQAGLQSDVSPARGNFSRSLIQVRNNLPKVSDVNGASGFDQAQLLVYAACSDLTTGNTPVMRSKYSVNPGANVTTNQAALVAAGRTMLDQHTAGVASRSSAQAQITTIFTNLVQAQLANSSTVAFMAVCIAANSAGAFMLGL